MSEKESRLHSYFQQVQLKTITLTKTAELTGIGYRQIKRLWKKFKDAGVSGLISKKRGMRSNRKLSEVFCQEILTLIKDLYVGLTPLFITEKLQTEHGITVSDETVRKLMIQHHLWIPKKIKSRLHQRRLRRECIGELVQLDASDHLWFEDRGPRCHLHVIVDDATSAIKGAYFDKEETTRGYYEACKPYFEREGTPISIYCDRRGTFKVNHKDVYGITQFQRAMKELNVKMIFAYSPEAKGRVERAFRTLQNRLVGELRLQRISTIEEANKYLPSFIQAYNAKFGKEPKNSFNTHHHLSKPEELKYILSYKHQRKLSKNLEIRFKGETYQIQVAPHEQYALKGVIVDVIETLDGEVQFEYLGRRMKFKVFGENFVEYQKPIQKEKSKRVVRRDIPWRTSLHLYSKKAPENSAERKIVLLRLQKRRKDSREDNMEILKNNYSESKVINLNHRC